MDFIYVYSVERIVQRDALVGEPAPAVGGDHEVGNRFSIHEELHDTRLNAPIEVIQSNSISSSPVSHSSISLNRPPSSWIASPQTQNSN